MSNVISLKPSEEDVDAQTSASLPERKIGDPSEEGDMRYCAAYKGDRLFWTRRRK